MRPRLTLEAVARTAKILLMVARVSPTLATRLRFVLRGTYHVALNLKGKRRGSVLCCANTEQATSITARGGARTRDSKLSTLSRRPDWTPQRGDFPCTQLLPLPGTEGRRSNSKLVRCAALLTV